MVVYRPSRRRRVVLALLLLTSVTLLTLDLRGGDTGPIGSAQGAVRDALAPVQDAVNGAISPVADWFAGIRSAGSLKSQNRDLREQLRQLKGDAARVDAALQENEALRKIDALPFLGGITAPVAEVVRGPVGNLEWTIVVNKGSDEGIATGMPVVAADGLVGRVISTSGKTATVRLLVDSLSRVTVRLPDKNLGIVKGESGRTNLALDLAPGATVKVGDQLVTAGLENGLYPAGIPVGAVESVDAGGPGKAPTAVVKPSVDPDGLQFVRIMRWPSG